MKAIGSILLISIFLIGSYILGKQQVNLGNLKKIDSLNNCLRKEKTIHIGLTKTIDSLKKEVSKSETIKVDSNRRKNII